MADAVALIVAGSGEISDKEVFDLIEDWAGGLDPDAEITLVIPTSKSYFTEAVEAAAEWFVGDESVDPKKDVVSVKVDGENGTRASSKYGDGPEEVENFGDLFNDDFDGFDEVFFFVAMPEPEASDYDEHVAWLEAAEAGKVQVTLRNLCAGLDDIVMIEPEVAEAEPEPEPVEEKKPARRGRSRSRAAAEPDPEPEPPKEEAPKPARRSRAKAKEEEPVKEPELAPFTDDDYAEVMSAVHTAREYFRLVDQSLAIYTGEPFTPRALTTSLEVALSRLVRLAGTTTPSREPAAPEEAQDESTEATPASGRGRGRPRTNFEVKEVLDEETNEWVARPRGRLAKGTQWRTRDDRDDSILDEGTA